MTIESLAREHVRSVAALHCASLHGLLSALGPPAARAYYAACVTVPLAAGFVAVDGGVRGFVLGSTAPGALKRSVARQRPLAVAGAVAVGVVRRPAALGWLLQSFRGPDEGYYDSSTPELIYLAVAPGQRGSGVGRQLVDVFSAAMRRQGASRYELSVDEDNAAAMTFYERVGFARIGRYREFGRYHVRYAIQLAAR